MASRDTDGRLAEQRLYAAGWRKGSLFQAPGVLFGRNEVDDSEGTPTVALRKRPLRTKEKLVLITQDCDVVASIDVEPNVEAMICAVESKQDYVARIDRNSTRMFLINPATGLVANARYRLQVSKKVLATLTPEPWPSSSRRLDRFVRWLARRYDRPAVPDRIVEAFQRPVEEVLARIDQDQGGIGASFSSAVEEVRVSVPASEDPPFDLHLVLIVRPEGLTEAEADAIEIVKEAIQAGLDPKLVNLDPDIRILTEEEISLAEYRATRPLYLEYLTYRGEEADNG